MIKHDAQWKTIFDLLLLVLSVYNTLINGFYSAFGEPIEVYSEKYLDVMVWMDESIEFLFYFDFLLCFMQEYLDNESGVYVSDILQICKNYVKGSMIFDLLACIPFS